MNIEEAIEIVSYKLALKVGEQAKNDAILDPKIIDQALIDKATGKIREIDLRQYMLATRTLKQHRVDLFRLENEVFHRSNKQREEIEETSSGLQYEVLVASDRTKPEAGDKVEVKYEGRLIDGTIFDSSKKRGGSCVLELSKLIKGWKEGLQLMGEGATYRLYIPHPLGYGERGLEGKIPAFSSLVFEVELLAIVSD